MISSIPVTHVSWIFVFDGRKIGRKHRFPLCANERRLVKQKTNDIKATYIIIIQKGYTYMFENCGEKIQTWAKVLFWLGIISCIILAIVFGWETTYSSYSYRSFRDFQPVAFFSILIGGSLSVYICCLCLNAFGELVENVNKVRYEIERMREKQ